ncbi:DUF7059 domain-containing protein [Arthrobacter sp. KK5.5]|uniref:DUF7059 domain-containing protein n=1 Tax=Arthrobacter sp. KK5.5 TaxID=3373084 RepID=UPI003EE61410
MNPTDDFSRVPDAPQSHDQTVLDALAGDLLAAGYLHDAVTELVGEEAHAALNRDQVVPALVAVQRKLALPAPPSLAVVVGLWMLGLEQPTAAVDRAFPRCGAAGLVALGLAAPVEGADLMRATADLRPHASDADAEIWVASDLGAHQRPGPLRHDHVLGIGRASLTLAQTTIRRDVRRALDLGTGCGIQAFHLLSHADSVVATDVSERALAFTRFNLLLNHRALDVDPAAPGDRVDLRLGSLLDPVAGEQFDLVVSNPPFVITPHPAGEFDAERYTYRDGGLPGDRLVAGLVAGLPAVLAPGGTAQLLANWEITADDAGDPDWARRPRSWVPEGTEAWFIQRETASPEEYAETWLRDSSEARDPDRYRRRYVEYLEDFASRSVLAVGFGMVWLRRARDPGRMPVGRRFEEIGYPIEQPIGPHLDAAVEAAGFVAGAEVADLLLVCAEDVTEERHQRPGAEHPGVILLRQGAGLRRTTLLSTEEAGFVSACDGQLTVRQIALAIAALLDRDPDETLRDLSASVVRLVTGGFLCEMRNNG